MFKLHHHLHRLNDAVLISAAQLPQDHNQLDLKHITLRRAGNWITAAANQQIGTFHTMRKAYHCWRMVNLPSNAHVFFAQLSAKIGCNGGGGNSDRCVGEHAVVCSVLLGLTNHSMQPTLWHAVASCGQQCPAVTQPDYPAYSIDRLSCIVLL